MKLDQLIAHHVAGTSLNGTGVKGFLTTPPHYYQWGMSCQLDPQALSLLNATDLFGFYLRYYLTGRHKTLRAVLRAARVFVHQDAHAAHHLIGYCLEDTRQRLLTLEWYELLPRLGCAQVRILAVAPGVDGPLGPGLVRFLEESG